MKFCNIAKRHIYISIHLSYENYISLTSYIKYTCKYTFMAKHKYKLQFILSIVLFDLTMKFLMKCFNDL